MHGCLEIFEARASGREIFGALYGCLDVVREACMGVSRCCGGGGRQCMGVSM